MNRPVLAETKPMENLNITSNLVSGYPKDTAARKLNSRASVNREKTPRRQESGMSLLWRIERSHFILSVEKVRAIRRVSAPSVKGEEERNKWLDSVLQSNCC